MPQSWPKSCLCAHRCWAVWPLIGVQLFAEELEQAETTVDPTGAGSASGYRSYGVGRTPGWGFLPPPASLSIFTWRDWVPLSHCIRKPGGSTPCPVEASGGGGLEEEVFPVCGRGSICGLLKWNGKGGDSRQKCWVDWGCPSQGDLCFSEGYVRVA